MKKINTFKKFALIALVVFGFTSCNNDDDPVVVPDTTITSLAVNSPNLSILVRALTRADLAATLRGTGPFTVFAPTNEAFTTLFAALGPNVTVDNVDVTVLKSILLNHVIGSQIKSSDIPASTYVSTLSPFNSTANAPTISMFVQKDGNTVTLNGGIGSAALPRKGAVVTTADIIASNGVIHIVNRVIQIPNVVDHAISNPNFTSLVAALTRQGNTTNFASILSGTTSSPFTVFAPTNDAFTAALTELNFATLAAIPEPALDKILKYHVIAGANVLASQLPGPLTNQNTFLGQTFQIGTTGGARIVDQAGRTTNIVATDVQTSNGVIHVVNKVLVPNL